MSGERINRIRLMERYYDDIRTVSEADRDRIYENAEAARKILILADYMDSGLWLSDYEADERGELPKELKRGVLSQDGLYNLLCRLSEKNNKKDLS